MNCKPVRYEIIKYEPTKDEVLDGMWLLASEIENAIKAGETVNKSYLWHAYNEATEEFEAEAFGGLANIGDWGIYFTYEYLCEEIDEGNTIDMETLNSVTEYFCNNIDEIFDDIYANYYVYDPEDWQQPVFVFEDEFLKLFDEKRGA